MECYTLQKYLRTFKFIRRMRRCCVLFKQSKNIKTRYFRDGSNITLYAFPISKYYSRSFLLEILILNKTYRVLRRSLSKDSTTSVIFEVSIIKLLCPERFGLILYLYLGRLPKFSTKASASSAQFSTSLRVIVGCKDKIKLLASL